MGNGHLKETGEKHPSTRILENPVYERLENVVSLTRIDHGEGYKRLCEACPEHGKRFSCPPHSPSFPLYVGSAQWARVICLRFERKHFGQLASADAYLTDFFRKAGKKLTDELLVYRKMGYVIAGSGPCLLCEPCAAEIGRAHCSEPDGPIYSLESMGVNVADLCKKAFDIDLEWHSEDRQEGHVCVVGAVFSEGFAELVPH